MFQASAVFFMEDREQLGEESCSSRHPLIATAQALNPSVSTSLGLCLVLASLVVVRSQPPKSLSTVIKLADGAIKGTKALQFVHSPSPQSFVLASKALVKGYKVTKRLIPAAPSPKIPSTVAARLKACIGAVNLLRHSSSPLLADGSLGIGFLKGGYQVSKNSAKVIEGFVGLQLNSAVKDGLDALGLLVKAATVGREVQRLISVELSTRKRLEYLFLRSNSRHGVCLSCKRSEVDGFYRYPGPFHAAQFPLLEGAVTDKMDLGFQLSELLCLSIPVNEVEAVFEAFENLQVKKYEVKT
ncbi:hypothetical protein Cni_G18700 [Canna indica]|uniref:Uncharacterized protein n=1 Tax=Canna indica TaxID=4628 RepID=A0AAQ3QHU2_9LILI|nr:hypothetical protein Cni_G18700 [Canna indica]